MLKATLRVCTFLLLLQACKNKPIEYFGESMLNYPDMKVIWHDYIEHLQKEQHSILKIEIKNNKRDSAYIQCKDIQWTEIKEIFDKANLYNKNYDKQYDIEVLSDTASPMLKLIYTSLNPQNFTQLLSIQAETFDNKIKSLYFETEDKHWWKSIKQKVLFVNNKTIQIQHISNGLIGGEQKKILQYIFADT